MKTKLATRPAVILLLLVTLLGSSCGSQTHPPTAQPTVPLGATAPEVAPTQAIAPTQAAVPDIAGDLQGLDFGTFVEDSYRKLLLRDPQAITELGLVERFGTGNDRLTDISDAYIRETQDLQAAILATLRAYDRSSLSAEEQLSYDIYEWWLDDRVRGHPYMYNDHPASFLITTGVNEQLVQFFTDIHPITNKKDAEDYVTRLSQVKAKLEQLVDGLRRREEAGVVMPGFLLPWVLYSVQNVAVSSARTTDFYTTFRDKVNALSELSAEEKQTLLEAAEKAINESVLPGFQALTEYLEHQQSIATDDEGVWKLPNGADYYAYTLRHHTTTDLTSDEIHQLGLQELERIHAEMRALFGELGYPQEESLPRLIGRVVQDSGTLSGEEVARTYEAIIEEARERVTVAFDLLPQADVIVIAGPAGDYYSAPAMDGSRPGAFYARVTGSKERFAMPTLAYHEAVPGHHFQLAIAQELPGLPLFRSGVDFMAYVEGWALYAERLAYELGFYRDDPYGDIGRLQAEAFRAARLVVDTGIHAKKWSYDQAVDFMIENTGLPRNMVEIEVARYIVWPGQATAYYIGMIKLLEVRQKAMDELGDRFDLTEFHNVVLSNGAVPLGLLERIVEDWIEVKQGE